MRARVFRFSPTFLGSAGIGRNKGLNFIGMSLTVERIISTFQFRTIGNSIHMLGIPFFAHRNASIDRCSTDAFTLTVGADLSNSIGTTSNTFGLTRKAFVPTRFASGTEYGVA